MGVPGLGRQANLLRAHDPCQNELRVPGLKDLHEGKLSWRSYITHPPGSGDHTSGKCQDIL